MYKPLFESSTLISLEMCFSVLYNQIVRCTKHPVLPIQSIQSENPQKNTNLNSQIFFTEFTVLHFKKSSEFTVTFSPVLFTGGAIQIPPLPKPSCSVFALSASVPCPLAPPSRPGRGDTVRPSSRGGSGSWPGFNGENVGKNVGKCRKMWGTYRNI